MRRQKVLFWLVFASLAAVSVFLFSCSATVTGSTNPAAQGLWPRMTATPNIVLTALPTIFAADRLDLVWSGEECGKGTIYTSLPAKCLTAHGLREAAPRVSPNIIQITAIPVP